MSSVLTPQSYQLFAREWTGAQGLAEDVRYYGKWMRDEAEKRIGHLYPKIEITAEMAAERPDLKPLVGRELTVIAWLWARTVKRPNPAFADVDVPLASTFMLSTKAGKEAYVEPVIESRRQEIANSPAEPATNSYPLIPVSSPSYRFTVKVGKPVDAEAAKNGTKLARGAHFRCLMSGAPIASEHIYGEANAGRMGARLMAIVAEGDRGRVYLAPTGEHEATAREAQPEWKPDVAMPENPRWFSPPLYGLKTYGDLFTPRQLVALTTFSDLVGEARERIQRDAEIAFRTQDPGHSDASSKSPVLDTKSLSQGGTGAAYADAVVSYLGLAISRFADRNNALCTWDSGPTGTRASTGGSARTASLRNLFARQAIPMAWDFGEANPFSDSGGGFHSALEWVEPAIRNLLGATHGRAVQADASSQGISLGKVVSADPPYYDNIGYADLSDFFYVWLRRSLRPMFPELFATLAVPKAEELVATPYRHGSKEKAETFFLDGMTQAMHRLAEQAHPAFPVTIYYAFKQQEMVRTQDLGHSSVGDLSPKSYPLTARSTGWETFLDAIIRAGFGISGTWPMRTELGNRMIGAGTNALASSIVLVCRPRPDNAPTVTRGEFVRALKAELPGAVRLLQGLASDRLSPKSYPLIASTGIAPVDLAQAAIGPGMAVYTRYAKVLDAEGKPLPVREALALINQTLDEVLAEQEGDFDADSRWALAWFEQSGFAEGDFGVAEVLSKAKVTSVQGLVDAGILAASRGKVRLLHPEELDPAWDPATDARLTAWEAVHHLIRVLGAGGESAAAELVGKLGTQAEVARELAYRLYSLCERKKRAAEALAYNALVQSFPEILRLAQERPAAVPPEQPDLYD